MTTGSFGHVDLAWEDPGIALFLHTLASFSRLIMFDRRGTGAVLLSAYTSRWSSSATGAPPDK
jgi:hypothetical protein